MNQTEKTFVSAFTLVGTLALYYYSKHNNKDTVPYTLIGGFVGAWIGEILAQSIINKNKKENNGNPK